METLKPEHIARFVPHALKYKIDGITHECVGLENDIMWCIKHRDSTGSTSVPISSAKYILRNINTLTTKQRLEGYDEEVVPLVELAKISIPFLDWSDMGYCALGSGGIDYEQFDFEEGTFARYIENDNDDSAVVPNQTKLFEWLEKHKFNAWGIPDELVEYVTEENNPYV